ncbi:hypothetical protein DV515_00011458 [Chloebia gouldiae]|uniref:Protein kinase domain-containing protein n=1 Tax=Chloebia gouldiae TaxID=44316 RepID=A0A3L8S7N4_CHLGU|nr:hypothetical protein DV515_00011458 [Chloebia gouldiae]
MLVFLVPPCRYAVSASLVPADPSAGFRKLHKTQVFHQVLDVSDLHRLREGNVVRLKMQKLQSSESDPDSPPSLSLAFDPHVMEIPYGIFCRTWGMDVLDQAGIASARLVRTESVPCDINNPLRKPPRYSDLHVSQTLPKTNKLNKDHIPVPYQPDSSSNPSSTTSSTPSSPAPPLPPSATPPSPLHPSPQCPRQQKQFNLPASHYYKYKQQFIFPDVVPETPTRAPQVVLHPVTSNPILEGNPLLQIEVEPTSENEEGAEEVQESEDDFEEMNLSLLSARNFPRKASQTSIFLQEWDIPFEQLEIGELIGKGRFGQVFHGRWHGEVAIRLIDIERDNEDQLKAFKREVMAYRQTRHENVVLFMGACMSPPHLAIITRLELHEPGWSLHQGRGVGHQCSMMATNTEVMATNVEVVATNVKVMAICVELMPISVEMIATSLEAVATSIGVMAVDVETMTANVEVLATSAELMTFNIAERAVSLKARLSGDLSKWKGRRLRACPGCCSLSCPNGERLRNEEKRNVELCHEKVLQVVAEWAQVLHKSLCKGRTLYSVVRDAKIVLDVNKTRQIAQEIVKMVEFGLGFWLHISHQLKNKFFSHSLRG